MARINRSRILAHLVEYRQSVQDAVQRVTGQEALSNTVWLKLVQDGNRLVPRLSQLQHLNSASLLYCSTIEEAMLTLKHLRLITKHMIITDDSRRRDLIYPIKHALMELLVSVAESEIYTWYVGLATDSLAAVSLRFELQGRQSVFRLRLHWPLGQITPRAQTAIFRKCGTYPPREVLPWN